MDLDSLLRAAHSLAHRVEPGDTALAYGSGGVEVLATPALVGLMETAARDAVQQALPPGTTTVGSLVNIRHLAPTPVGRDVRVSAAVTAVDGRRITFRVEADDDAGRVGEGVHERVVVDLARFGRSVAARYGASS